jgi:flagellar FliL protein
MADAAAAEEAQSPPARGGGNKLLFAILFAVLLSGGVGGGVYFSMNHKAEATADEGEEEADAADEESSAAADDAEAKPKKGKKGKKGKKAAPKAPAVFVPFDPPFVANFEADGELRFLQVQVEVMTRDPLVAEQIKTQTPVIRNELLLLFGSVDATKIATREGKEKIRQDALDSIRRIVTEEGGKGEKIEQVYFTSFVMQ